MFHYLFTNDLRISNLNEVLVEAARCFLKDTVPSAQEDKNKNNNMKTLGMYFNLTKDSVCSKQCANRNTKAVIWNYVKKFQFPNIRTDENLRAVLDDGIKIAPLRVIVGILWFFNMYYPESAYLTHKEIYTNIFANEKVAKNENFSIIDLANNILSSREDGYDEELPDDDKLREAEGFYWKHCKRQIREMVKILEWTDAFVMDGSSKIKIRRDSLTSEAISYIIDIIMYEEFWEPDLSYNEKELQQDYEKYMDIKKGSKGNIMLNYITNILQDSDRNRIIFGAPGTGKSYKLKTESEELLKDTEGVMERVTFHPDYTYSQFVGAYKPVTDEIGDIRYDFVPGPFMRVYVEALRNCQTDNPQPYLLIIEEINRANMAAVFGDIFQLLDRDENNISEYPIQTTEDVRKYLAKELEGNPEDYKEIRIPDNMFIWATMNSADQGVFPMDTAFKRRWDFTYLGINSGEENISGKTVTLGKGDYKRTVEWNDLRKAINGVLVTECKVNEDKLMGPFFIAKKYLPEGVATDEENEKFIKVFKNKVIMYLFDDAAKQKRATLFDGCEKKNVYSAICDEFDNKGVAIFNEAIRSKFPDTENEDEE